MLTRSAPPHIILRHPLLAGAAGAKVKHDGSGEATEPYATAERAANAAGAAKRMARLRADRKAGNRSPPRQRAQSAPVRSRPPRGAAAGSEADADR